MDIVGTGLLNELPEHIRHFLQLVFLISFNFTKKKKKEGISIQNETLEKGGDGYNKGTSEEGDFEMAAQLRISSSVIKYLLITNNKIKITTRENNRKETPGIIICTNTSK